MRFAIVSEGRVVNIVLSKTALFPNWIKVNDSVAIGDYYYNDSFHKNPEGE